MGAFLFHPINQHLVGSYNTISPEVLLRIGFTKMLFPIGSYNTITYWFLLNDVVENLPVWSENISLPVGLILQIEFPDIYCLLSIEQVNSDRQSSLASMLRRTLTTETKSVS